MMEIRERHIIFTLDNDQILDLSFHIYKPGVIKEARESLSKLFHCRPDEIEVLITGIEDEVDKYPVLRLINGGAQMSDKS